jgi:hypothetical protein
LLEMVRNPVKKEGNVGNSFVYKVAGIQMQSGHEGEVDVIE